MQTMSTYFLTLMKLFRRHAAFALFFMIPMQLMDGLNGVCQGIFRGMGRQKIGACVNVAAYYIIGLPLAYFLGFQLNWNIEGIWVGMTLGAISSFITYVILIRRTNWVVMAEKARERVEK